MSSAHLIVVCGLSVLALAIIVFCVCAVWYMWITHAMRAGFRHSEPVPGDSKGNGACVGKEHMFGFWRDVYGSHILFAEEYRLCSVCGCTEKREIELYVAITPKRKKGT